MIKKLLLILLALLGILVLVIAGLFAFASTKPDDFQVSRSTTIAAPAPVVFEQVNNLKKWNDWSPWAKRDPNIKLTYTGPEAGKDATYAWTGNHEVGKGQMTITNSVPNEKVEFRLEFLEPFAATNTAAFNFAAEGDKTKVTWTMAGKNNLVGKVMCTIMDMDKMIGGDFEAGLSSMKAIAEKEAASAPASSAPVAPTTPAPEAAPAPAPAPNS
ncbi:polyketide cyclase/dehydrase/lipid transport protein [Roseimicrobium gellanilyticum]|uniref:Polyketide cyclase/dehydrase/lipid transport protein n=1 Tax=Roseimicrobium gellanilyticum TaxID=748857 RepID=A0A366H2L0_9BACT|nr:SRPBCC family protein [Roseimicrobium gellanilyticum]RBP36140.1 polyketide cyclase/dehydrase/lipid transport protein [Roseimicrobium gellanilyticum]